MPRSRPRSALHRPMASMYVAQGADAGDSRLLVAGVASLKGAGRGQTAGTTESDTPLRRRERRRLSVGTCATAKAISTGLFAGVALLRHKRARGAPARS